MATVSAVILKADGKKDGTWNVKIRVGHNSQSRYIPTEHFVNARQIKRDSSIKDPFLIKLLNQVMDDYRIRISNLGPRLKRMKVDSLVDFLTNGKEEPEIFPDEIDILDFGRTLMKARRADGRNGSANDLRRVVNSLQDFFGKKSVPVTAISSKMLKKFEKFLRSERTIVRRNKYDEPTKRVIKGITDTGIHNYMRDIRILFNEACDLYNDEEMGRIVISHRPFKVFKIVENSPAEDITLTLTQLLAVRDVCLPAGSRVEMTRDLFMLSFYLCGTNAADLHEIPLDMVNRPRYDYNRAKTRGRRKDNAFISMDIPDEARELLVKYAGQLQVKYSRYEYLDAALYEGMKLLRKMLRIKNLKFYSARHTFADLARNVCGFSFDDIGLAMNHEDQEHKVTWIYVKKSWAIVDKVQRGVLNLLKPAEDTTAAVVKPTGLNVRSLLHSVNLPVICKRESA